MAFSVQNENEELPRKKKYIMLLTTFEIRANFVGRNDVTKKGPGYLVLFKMATLILNFGDGFCVDRMHFRN